MKEKLIELQFEKWLLSLDIAPYPVMFWDIPKFVQYSYIQKYLREILNISIFVSSKTDGDKTFFISHGRTIPDTIKKGLIVDIIPYSTFLNHEEAVNFGIIEALKQIKTL